MFRQPGQFTQMLPCDFLRFVGMNSHGRVNPIVLLGERQRGIELLGTRSGADGEQGRDARGTGTVKHGVAVFRELREINVRVGVYEFHWLSAQGRGNRRARYIAPLLQPGADFDVFVGEAG
jgi:hypothetical protein